MIESEFGYGKGYVRDSKSSNFYMFDASNIATIELMKLIPYQWTLHENCFCVDCAGEIHAREAAFDTIKTEIEKCMKIAWEQGREYERS